jgi:O-antigen/teichoic acid export membrane protein
MNKIKYKINSIYLLLFSGTHDLSSVEGQANERNRRIALSALTSMTARVVNLLAGLITVPLTLPYLGVEQFGIWMALTGFVAFLAFTDLGLSIGLQAALTACHGKNDQKKPSYLISSGLSIIILISMTLIICSIFIFPLFDFTKVILIENPNNENVLLHTVQSILIVFAIGLPAGMIQRTFEAYQDGMISNILLIIGRFFSLGSVYVCVHFEISLSVMVALYMGLPFVFIIIGGVILFIKRSWLRPSFFKVRKKCVSEIFNVGRLAFSAQVGASIMSTGPLLVLTSQYGAMAIVPFAIAQRLFGIVSMIQASILGPLWPAYGEAKARGDWTWIISTLKKSIIWSSAVVIPCFFAFAFFGQWIILIWSQDADVVPGWALLMACNFWMLLLAGVRVFSMFLNGTGAFKGQAIYGVVIPFVAVYLGWVWSGEVEMINCLMLMLVGELGRLIFMSFETYRVYKKRAGHASEI